MDLPQRRRPRCPQSCGWRRAGGAVGRAGAEPPPLDRRRRHRARRRALRGAEDSRKREGQRRSRRKPGAPHCAGAASDGAGPWARCAGARGRRLGGGVTRCAHARRGWDVLGAERPPVRMRAAQGAVQRRAPPRLGSRGGSSPAPRNRSPPAAAARPCLPCGFSKSHDLRMKRDS